MSIEQVTDTLGRRWVSFVQAGTIRVRMVKGVLEVALTAEDMRRPALLTQGEAAELCRGIAALLGQTAPAFEIPESLRDYRGPAPRNDCPIHGEHDGANCPECSADSAPAADLDPFA